mmetsp:Transcript_57683/g.153718  ORF Transcript_57683/g.153718 Transcript_57683/m.153718 type:complete len:347 (-) Transcript_57683:1528-2568(-)
MNHHALLRSSRTSTALNCVRLRHHLRFQCTQTRLWVESAFFPHAAINHIDHVVYRDGRLSDVGGQDNFSLAFWRPFEGFLLLLGCHKRMQGDQFEVFTRSVQFQKDLRDVAPTWKKHEDCTITLGLVLVEMEHQLYYQILIDFGLSPVDTRLQCRVAVRVCSLFTGTMLCHVTCPDGVADRLQGFAVWRIPANLLLLIPLSFSLAAAHRRRIVEHVTDVLPVVVINPKHSSWNVNRVDRPSPVHRLEVPREVIGLQRGTHQDDLQMLHPSLLHGLSDKQQNEISIHVTLVHFVHDEAAYALKVGLPMQTSQNNRRRCVNETCVLAEGVHKPNLVSYLVAQILLSVS